MLWSESKCNSLGLILGNKSLNTFDRHQVLTEVFSFITPVHAKITTLCQVLIF